MTISRLAPDEFFSLGNHQDVARVEARRRVERIENEIRLAASLEQLSHAPGWKEFVANIEHRRDAAILRALDEKVENRDFWAGVARGMASILTVMGDAGTVKRQAEDLLSSAKDQLTRLEAAKV